MNLILSLTLCTVLTQLHISRQKFVDTLWARTLMNGVKACSELPE